MIIPIHWGAYRTGKKRIEEPFEKFREAVERERMGDWVHLPKIGETFTIEHIR
jgi:L-ascorbate metabolism protein UlaG (beta-lactamase superfamily)